MESYTNCEYANYLRCKTCNRSTNGIKDFTSTINGRKLKTCKLCRRDVKKANHKRANPCIRDIVQTLFALADIPDDLTPTQSKIVNFAKNKYIIST